MPALGLGYFMKAPLHIALIVAFMFGSVSVALAAVVGASGSDDLVIVEGGKATATIAVAGDAGPQEANAAEDLATYIEMMSGARPQIVNALPVNGTTIVVVTHNPAFAESMPRVVRMKDGKVEVDDVGRAARTVDAASPATP